MMGDCTFGMGKPVYTLLYGFINLFEDLFSVITRGDNCYGFSKLVSLLH